MILCRGVLLCKSPLLHQSMTFSYCNTHAHTHKHKHTQRDLTLLVSENSLSFYTVCGSLQPTVMELKLGYFCCYVPIPRASATSESLNREKKVYYDPEK